MKEELVTQHMGDTVVLTIHGECSEEIAHALDQKCQEEMLKRVKHILVDCATITSLNPTILRSILSSSSEADKAGVNLVLYHLRAEHLAEVETAGLLSVLHVVPTFKDAYTYCRSHTGRAGSISRAFRK